MSGQVQLAADEVGLSFARMGGIVLRSQARPVFRRRGAWLRAEAVKIRTAAFHAGKALPWQPFRQELTMEEWSRVASVCRQLDLANHAHVADVPVNVLLGRLHEASDPFAAGLRDVTGQTAFRPGRVFMPLSAATTDTDAELAKLAQGVRRAGMGVCLLDLSQRTGIDECLDAIRPDIVRIDATWFMRLADRAPLRRLFGLMIERLHGCGAEVLVEGANDGLGLAVALDAGADLICGDALAGFSLVGCDFDSQPVEVAALMAQPANVIPMATSRRRRG